MKSLWSFEPGNFELFQYSETEQYQVKIVRNEPKLRFLDSDSLSQQFQSELVLSASFELVSYSSAPTDFPMPEKSQSEFYASDYSQVESEENLVSFYTLSSHYIAYCNVATEKSELSTVLSKPIAISAYSAYCLLDSGTIWVCVGDSPFSRLVYEIDPVQGLVQD